MKLNPVIPTAFALLVGVIDLVQADVTVDAKVGSKATHRGIEEADLNWQPSFEFGVGSLYAGAWSLRPLENKSAGFAERHEFYLGFTQPLSEKVALDLGGIRYDNPSFADSTEAYVGIWAELGTLSPSLYIYSDLDRDNWVFEAATTIAVPLQGFPGEVTGRVGLVDRENDYRYFELDLIYPWELSDSMRLSLGLHFSDNDLGRGNPGARVYGSAGMRWSF